MVRPEVVLFFFATDFVRLFWVLTLFDIVSLLYLLEKILRGYLPRATVSIAAVLLTVFFLIVLISGLFNSFYAFEHIVLVVGTSLAVVKAVAFLDALQTHGTEAWEPLVFGFLVLNILLFCAFIGGIGFSGSGRFSGFFPQTNGMAAFQTFAIATTLFALVQKRKFTLIFPLFLSLALLLLAGSRGSIVAAVVIVALVLMKLSRSTTQVTKLFLYPFMFGLIFISITVSGFLLFEISQFLSNSEFNGVQRIGAFISVLYYGDIAGVYTESRGVLNEAAYNHFLKEPTLFGHGYESSGALLNSTNRVHNIFLSSALELGALGLVFFLSAAILGCLMSFRNFSGTGIEFFFVLMFVATWFQSIKTPYYFLNGISWAVIIFSYGSNIRKLLADLKVLFKYD